MYKPPLVLCALLATLCSASSFALQSKSVSNNAQASAFIAKAQLTRIAVNDDRIVGVKGLEGYYQMEKDTTQGAIFIKPLGLGISRPFTLFITTEKGQNYTLKLNAKLNQADTILLKPIANTQTLASHWETQHPFIDNIVTVMTAMANQVAPKGYAEQAVKHPKHYQLGKRAQFQLIKRYQGAHLSGEVFQLVNSSNKSITLNPQSFYATNVAAIAIERQYVIPNGTSLIYRVIHNDN